jgi:hypothetical protein
VQEKRDQKKKKAELSLPPFGTPISNKRDFHKKKKRKKERETREKKREITHTHTREREREREYA